MIISSVTQSCASQTCLKFLIKVLKSHQSKLTRGCTFPAPLTEVQKAGTGPSLSFFTVLKFAHIILTYCHCSFNYPKLSEFSGSNVYFLNRRNGVMLNPHYSEQVILCFHEKKSSFLPFLCLRIFRCSSLSLKPSIFLFFLTTMGGFFWPLQFPVQKKATIILLQTHPALKMRNLSLFHCQPAQFIPPVL